jgi:hypothetical protein
VAITIEPVVDLALEIFQQHCEKSWWQKVESNPKNVVTNLLLNDFPMDQYPLLKLIKCGCFTPRKGGTNQAGSFIHGTVRCAKTDREKILAWSGTKAPIFLKDAYYKFDTSFKDMTILWSTKPLNELRDLATLVPDFSGIATNPSGLGIRVANTGLAKARGIVNPLDERFCDRNRSVIASKYFEVVGLPHGTSAPQLMTALEQIQWIIIPMRSFRRGAYEVWLVGSDKAPPTASFHYAATIGMDASTLVLINPVMTAPQQVKKPSDKKTLVPQDKENVAPPGRRNLMEDHLALGAETGRTKATQHGPRKRMGASQAQELTPWPRR